MGLVIPTMSERGLSKPGNKPVQVIQWREFNVRVCWKDTTGKCQQTPGRHVSVPSRGREGPAVGSVEGGADGGRRWEERGQCQTPTRLDSVALTHNWAQEERRAQ